MVANSLRSLVIGLIMGSMSGCILVPVIESFNQSGLTPSQRVAKLPVAVKEFQDAVFWGELSQALEYTTPESRQQVSKVLRRFPEDSRVVESKMVEADYGEEAYEAQVWVETKSYPVDSLLVSKQRSWQRWEFHIGDGWKLLELKELAEDSVNA